MERSLVLVAGFIGLACGAFWGESRGAARGARAIIMKTRFFYLLLGVLAGTLIPVGSDAISAKIGFLPRWIAVIIWPALLGVLFGIIPGYRLGRSFIISVSYSRSPNLRHLAPSPAPLLLGGLAGLALKLFILVSG